MWQKFKDICSCAWTHITDAWAWFELQVHRIAPGWKATITTFLGGVSSFASALQTYVSGMPLEKFIDAQQLAILTGVLFTLAFWFRGMGDRVDARLEA